MNRHRLICGLLVTTFYVSLVIAQPVTTETTENPKEIEVREKNVTKTCNDVELDFSDMNLQRIKNRFVSSFNVKSLKLQNNEIVSFEENTFDSLPNLEHLDLSNNKLTMETLFSFGEMRSLMSLILNNNCAPPILDSDSYCYRCCSPRSRYVYNLNTGTCQSKYSKMKLMYNYPNVNYLSIRKIYIDSIPLEMSIRFPKLSRLDISENNFEENSDSLMANIPSTVTELILENAELTILKNLHLLKQITNLTLNFNNFNRLSSQYCQSNTLCLNDLSNLKSLYISGCSISTIESDAFKDLANLTYLDISSNNFENIPNEVFDFTPNLTGLNISNNSLTSLPKTNRLQNLTILIMDEMKNILVFDSLDKLPELPMLEVLSMRKNKLSSVSSSFLNKLPKLQILDLSYNQITSLKSWSWQSNLQKLHLNSNKISNIEDLELNEAKSLELLDLQNNAIVSVKLSLLKHLKDELVFKL